MKNDVVLRAARGERTERTPIWMMRQAGRSDPEYNRLKERSGMTLDQLFRHPELAAEISLLPKRFGVDAIIYFQDILTPLAPMGAEFVFAPGPVLRDGACDRASLAKLHTYDVAEELPFIPRTFRLVRQAMNDELPVLGFAGAPFTLAVFILEGKSFGASAPTALDFFSSEPAAAHAMLDRLTEMTIDYLKLQIEAGASAFQLFESAAYLCTEDRYAEFALPYQQRIFEALRGSVPGIMFARDWTDLDSLNASGADVLSLAAQPPIAEARKLLGPTKPLQGNLDNRLLAHGTPEAIAAAARQCIDEGNHIAHIFNLSHGLLKETPLHNILHLVQTVKTYRCNQST